VTAFGYALSGEEHGPRDLVANAVAAEELRPRLDLAGVAGRA
jgi:hypothetical protein